MTPHCTQAVVGRTDLQTATVGLLTKRLVSMGLIFENLSIARDNMERRELGFAIALIFSMPWLWYVMLVRLAEIGDANTQRRAFWVTATLHGI
jgi:hypothetical protein